MKITNSSRVPEVNHSMSAALVGKFPHGTLCGNSPFLACTVYPMKYTHGFVVLVLFVFGLCMVLFVFGFGLLCFILLCLCLVLLCLVFGVFCLVCYVCVVLCCICLFFVIGVGVFGFIVFGFVVFLGFCCGCNMSSSWGHVIYVPMYFRVASLALGQSYDCPSASEATLKDMSKINQS